MTSAPFDSALLGPLLSDPETAELFSDESAVHALLEFEVALARVEERLGVIPAGAGAGIEAAAAALAPDWDRLGRGTVEAGHPVAALVEQLREQAGRPGDYVHWGATAQDAVDTALVLRLRVAFERFDARLRQLVRTLADRASRYRSTVMPGRTRFQQAVPITFGLKAATWLAPLARHRRRLAELRPRTLVVQFGGAAGTLGPLGLRGVSVMEALARELGLGAPPLPWHTQRDGMVEAAGWLAMVAGSLAKFGQDLALLAQTEVAEASDGSAGVSSTMPQKANPVRSEILVAAGRMAGQLLAAMHQGTAQEHERSGSGWTLEWLALPQLAVLTGASLLHAQAAAEALAVAPERMAENTSASGDLLLAEAAAFALASRFPLPQARRMVADACRAARETGEGMLAILERQVPAGVDWQVLRDPRNALGSAETFIDRAVADAVAQES